MSEEVIIEHVIAIASPQAAVFSFAAEYSNDPQWRSEVKRFEYPRPLKVGVTVVEHSEFQGHQLETPTVVVRWEPPRLTRVETVPGAAHHLVNVRTVTAIDAQTSRFTYRLVFDREVLRPVMPQLPSAKEISSWYGGVVKSYLENLKKIIESGSRAGA
jgi:hypothetical protein